MFYCDEVGKLKEHEETYMKKQIEDGVKDFFYRTKHHPNTVFRAASEFLAQIHETNYLEASTRLESKIFQGKLKALLRYGQILLRENGSYMIMGEHMEITDTVVKDNIVWPEYSVNDISITKLE